MPQITVYRPRPLKTSDGRKTTFSIDTKSVVYDKINGASVKVGVLLKDGTIALEPKYSAKHRDRLKQFDEVKGEMEG